ncbi:IclR family transcriptional regulator [Halogeometricum borinquense DSM 11551]|uniref:IclR family transcriptional regulator n=1 Tax=Halogeometricum borinquense (strain ATCC 700274 / DSM 11551 / JCM 10706 / KCTC 4070 / PR3) TaxID=469382 RepID=E4NPY2_HALBP|nr:helix-turn-helix domain-containing protein [Halogeometricum borinquense]ADQ67727.1 IclR-like transcriptional regulator [Halogeometricum borinquense DSM 11551]ELY23592.1 IclR family transcriptional regulator [Halogeometricum borinquense DSM 11551]
MARDQSAEEPSELLSVLDALDDADARAIIRALVEPMTASELSDECDIPLSTTYRKLDLLTEADLLVEGTEIRADGHHTTTYEVTFDEVRIELTDERRLDVNVVRPEQAPDQQLADIWSAVRRETK